MKSVNLEVWAGPLVSLLLVVVMVIVALALRRGARKEAEQKERDRYRADLDRKYGSLGGHPRRSID